MGTHSHARIGSYSRLNYQAKIFFMKKLLLIIILGASSSLAGAQQTAAAFLNMMPAAPGGICNTDVNNSARTSFISRVSDIDKKMDEEIQRRTKEIDGFMEQNEDKMKQNAMAKAGMSPELVQQMMALDKKSKGAKGDAYKAEKMKLADQMMQQNMNMSMEEVQKMKKMSKTGKAAWAQGYAEEKKAEAIADPSATQKGLAKMSGNNALVEQQQRLADSLGFFVQKFRKQVEEMENSKEAVDLQTQEFKLQDEVNELYKKNGGEQAIMTKLNALRGVQISYCNLMSPRYLDIMGNYRSFIQGALKPYDKLEELTFKVQALQTGVEVKKEPGLMALEQVRDYLGMLSKVYSYNHIRPESVYVGATP